MVYKDKNDPRLRAYQKRYRATDQCKAAAKRWRDSEHGKKQRARYYQENKESQQNYKLLRNYNISLKEKDEMILAQGNKCLICDAKFIGDHPCNTAAVIDHCHTTSKVRGILCNKCNRGLGFFNDSVSKLLSAARYLYEHKH